MFCELALFGERFKAFTIHNVMRRGQKFVIGFMKISSHHCGGWGGGVRTPGLLGQLCPCLVWRSLVHCAVTTLLRILTW